jgi:hypothetical protein
MCVCVWKEATGYTAPFFTVRDCGKPREISDHDSCSAQRKNKDCYWCWGVVAVEAVAAVVTAAAAVVVMVVVVVYQH